MTRKAAVFLGSLLLASVVCNRRVQLADARAPTGLELPLAR